MPDLGNTWLPRTMARGVLMGGGLSCGLLNCHPQGAPATAQLTTLAAAAPPHPAGPGKRLTRGALRRIEDRALLGAPTVFDPAGQFVADKTAEGCDLWETDSGQFVGTYPEQVCAHWALGRRLQSETEQGLLFQQIVPGVKDSAGQLTSPDGTQSAQWQGAQLSIHHGPAARPHARYTASCGATQCPPIVTAAWGPGGRQLAVVHAGESRILVLNAHDGRVAATLQLDRDDVVLGDMLAFGKAGVLALTGLRLSLKEASDHDPEHIHRRGAADRQLVNLYQFSDFAKPPRLAETPDCTLDDIITLDPYGNFLFSGSRGDRAAVATRSCDLRTGKRGRFASDSKDGEDGTKKQAEGTSASITGAHWIPGPYPIWETQVSIALWGAGSGNRHEATQLRTGPWSADVRSETRVLEEPVSPGADSGPTPECLARVVQPDGKTVVAAKPDPEYDSCQENNQDPSGRFIGVGQQTLRRIADNVELTVTSDGCATATGDLYACPSLGAGLHYVAGSDPRRIVNWRGDDLLPLLYRPNLIADFFAGRPILPPPADTYVGEPPGLKLLAQMPRRRPEEIQLSLRLENAKGTVTLRAFSKDRQLGAPIVLKGLSANGERMVALPLPANLCEPISLYACSDQENTCSSVGVPYDCKKTPPKK